MASWLSRPSVAPPLHVIHINTVLFFAGADGLQTSMRDAFGKPQGTVIRVHIGQVIMSIHTTLQNKEHVIEVLCRAKFKFSGYQRIHIFKKWALLSLRRMSLKTWWLKSGSWQITMKSNVSLIEAPRTNDKPCTCQSLGSVPSLHNQ